MTNVGFATLDVIPSFNGFAGRLERGTTPGLLAAGRTGGSRFGDAAGRSAGQRFGSVFRTAAKAGLFGALAVAAGAIKLGSDAIGEAREAQKVARQTQAVIKSTGGVAKVSAKDVGRLATKLSNVAGIDDELIQQGENVLLTFKDIRNEAGKGNRIFDEATKVALDMSTALGTDLKNANIQVGKALNDPIKGVTALTRVGVTFTEAQKDQIAALVESGDKLGAQKLILRELKSEFEGSARSQASASDRLKVAFGNVQEQLGKGLLPIVQDFSRFLLREGVPAARDFTRWFTKDGLPAIKDLAGKLKPLAEKLLPAAATAFKSIRNFASDALPLAEGIVGAFNNMPGWVKKVLIGGVAGGLAAKKLGLGKITGTLFTKGSTPVNPLYVLDVAKGVGSGGLGNGSKVVSALGKGGLLAAFGITSAIVLRESGKHMAEGFNAWVSVVPKRGGSEGPDRTGGAAHPESSLTFAERFGTVLDENERRIGRNNAELEKTRRKIRANLQAMVEFDHSVPRSIESTFRLFGIDVANAQINGMFDTFIRRNEQLRDRFFDDSPTGQRQPPNHSPGTASRGVVVNIDTVQAHDYKDFTTQISRRTISGASDGWRG